MEKTDVMSENITYDKLLEGISESNPGYYIRALNFCQLLKYTIPPLYDCIGVKQNTYHKDDVYQHCLKALEASEKLTENPLLRLAILLHDIGKPATKRVGTDKRIHFFGHEVIGAQLANQYLIKLEFPKKDINYICKMIRYHQFRFSEELKYRKIKRWLQDLGKDAWRDIITLRYADRLGNSAKKNKPMSTWYLDKLIEKAEEIIANQKILFKEDLAVSDEEITKLVDSKGYSEIIFGLIAVLNKYPENNNRKWIMKYLSRY